MLLSEDEQVSQAYKNGPLGSVPIDWEKTPFSELFVSFIEYTNDLDRFPSCEEEKSLQSGSSK